MAKQAKRGFMPTDERDFSDKAQTVLRKAAEEVGYLLDRGYPVKSVTTFVGNHYLLSERQRLALARALLHDPAVYIFDEATSSIDVESEEAILARIRELAKEKTVVMISHRLANTVTADCIYAMEDGSVTESGTHGELLKNGETYARLWETQQALENYGKGESV